MLWTKGYNYQSEPNNSNKSEKNYRIMHPFLVLSCSDLTAQVKTYVRNTANGTDPQYMLYDLYLTWQLWWLAQSTRLHLGYAWQSIPSNERH